jgi:hypothetical protein
MAGQQQGRINDQVPAKPHWTADDLRWQDLFRTTTIH